jgi:DNA repair protein RecN (Recombination protein N)
MLKELRLTNIVLVESAVLVFASGFNILSGESGSGKSAIMNALNLIAGDRSDTSIIRRGSEKGTVEAVFDIDAIPLLHQFLNESGIEHEPSSELFIKRELSASGKSRAFINNQLAQLSLLKQVSAFLFDIVGQHANQKLLSLDYHRQALDAYGDLQEDCTAFAVCWDKEMHVRTSLEKLIHSEAQRMRDIEICRMEIEELLQANLKDDEEELFAEYTQLSNADELAQKTGEISRALDGEKGSVLALLSRQKNPFEQLALLAPSLSEIAAAFENALLELQEVAHSLRTFESRIEHNPARAAELNERLELIAKLKRKYGATVPEMQNYLIQSQQKLTYLENADVEIEELQQQLKELNDKSNFLAQKLSEKRRQAARDFQCTIVNHLQALNMPKVEFIVDISQQKRSRNGDDKIEFFLVPNVGENQVSLRDCASGGELSRVMLAMQAMLAGKEQIPCLIFDEIDANIGGETATAVGEKLSKIGSQHQVLCITHFPQVAKFAEHHLKIFKQEVDGRTVTNIDILNKTARHQEIARMQGVAGP